MRRLLKRALAATPLAGCLFVGLLALSGGCPDQSGREPPDPDDDRSEVTYSARATVVRGTILGQAFSVVDTGELPPDGGILHEALLEVGDGGVVVGRLGSAVAAGVGRGAVAEAAVADLEIVTSNQQIRVDFVRARANVECLSGVSQISPSSNSQLARLIINGQTFTVDETPNREIPLTSPQGAAVGRIVVNEQVSQAAAGFTQVTVTALRVHVFDVLELAIAETSARIDCGRVTDDGDFVTGGGFIASPNGERASFGFAVGQFRGLARGGLVFRDESSNVFLRSAGVDSYEIVRDLSGVATNKRRASGPAIVNGAAGTVWTLEVTDNGEPGTSDTFQLTLSSGYEASGTLLGGNINLHSND